MPTTPPLVLHPGWQNSGPEHRQSHWQNNQPGSSRVPQIDWDHPNLNDWVQTLDRHLAQQAQPVLLACHSLGCLTLLHWLARHPQHQHRIAGALLVAPPMLSATTPRPRYKASPPYRISDYLFPASWSPATTTPIASWRVASNLRNNGAPVFTCSAARAISTPKAA